MDPRWVFLNSFRSNAGGPIGKAPLQYRHRSINHETACHADESQPKAEPDDGLDWETIGPDGVALPPESKLDIGPTESSGMSGLVLTVSWHSQLSRTGRCSSPSSVNDRVTCESRMI